MRKALVIGIDDYPTAPLHGCVNDARAMASVLDIHGNEDRNFDIQVITQPAGDITRASLRRKIQELFSGENEIAFLYFAGHGMITSTGGCIVTPDYEAFDEGISMSDILLWANKSSAKEKVIFLDCCHSGKLGDLPGGNLAQIAEGVSILTASRGSEKAKESDGSGVFTSLVVDAMKGGAADLRGHITPGSIYAYVDQALDSWDQRPIFKTNVSRFVSLRKVKSAVPLSSLKKICDYFKDPNKEYPLNPTYEESHRSAKPEKVTILRELQRFNRVGLVRPVDEEHMYYAAINSKSCKLTPPRLPVLAPGQRK